MTNHPASDRFPAWSSSGETAFSSDRSGKDEIYVMKADGSGLKQITDGQTRNNEPRWSPEGKWLAYHCISDDATNICILPSDGSEPVTVIAGTTPVTQSPSSTSHNDNPAVSESQPPPEDKCQPPLGWTPITIQANDSLDSLSLTHNTNITELLQANCLTNFELLPGTRFYIPPVPVADETILETSSPEVRISPEGWITYIVRSGDTLFGLSLSIGVSLANLQSANCMDFSTRLNTGQHLFMPNVPTRTPLPTQTSKVTVISSSPPPAPQPPPSETPGTATTPTNTQTTTPTPTNTPTHTNTTTNTPVNSTATVETPTATQVTSTATQVPPTTFPIPPTSSQPTEPPEEPGFP
jgi:LysM repeat protein